jgi:hypothetical protein
MTSLNKRTREKDLRQFLTLIIETPNYFVKFRSRGEITGTTKLEIPGIWLH